MKSNTSMIVGITPLPTGSTFAQDVGQIRRVQIQKKHKGYSLVELTIALAILAVIIVSSLIGVQKLLRTNSINNELKALPVTTSGIAKVTVNAASLEGINTGVLIKLGVWPQDRVVGTGDAAKVLNQFGGRQYVNPNASSMAGYDANQLFIVTLTGIPAEACAEFVAGIDPLALGIYVGTNNDADPAGAVSKTVAKNPGSSTSAAERSINIAQVAQACGNPGSPRIRVDIVVSR